jgi:hypothetical protein|tara:strand:- start:394 stop:984 length:591 start_codon:yes stop_codon:yes gene_type:complete
MKQTLDHIFILSFLFLISCGGVDIVEEIIDEYENGDTKVEMKFKSKENVLERYAYNQVGELIYFEVDSLMQRDFFRSYLLGEWKMKFMIVDEDTVYNNSNVMENSQNIYKFTHDSLFVNGWKYEASYKVKYIDSLSFNLNGQWKFDDDSLSTYRVTKVNDKDTLTINSYSEFIWNNFLNTADKEETVVFTRNKVTL